MTIATTKRRLEGSVQVTSANGDTVLDETFSLKAVKSEAQTETSDGANAAFYADVLTEAGTYDVSVTLNDEAIDGISEATESVQIGNPDEEMLAIALGADDVDAPIGFKTGRNSLISVVNERFSVINQEKIL